MFVTLLLTLVFVAPAQPHFHGATVEITDLGSCTGCAGSITRAMARIDGVVEAVLEADATVRVATEDGVWIDPAELRDIVRRVGYTAGSVESSCRGRLARKEGRALFTPAEGTQEAGLPVEDPEGLISETVTGVGHFVSTASSPTPVLRGFEP